MRVISLLIIVRLIALFFFLEFFSRLAATIPYYAAADGNTNGLPVMVVYTANVMISVLLLCYPRVILFSLGGSECTSLYAKHRRTSILELGLRLIGCFFVLNAIADLMYWFGYHYAFLRNGYGLANAFANPETNGIFAGSLMELVLGLIAVAFTPFFVDLLFGSKLKGKDASKASVSI